MRQSREIRRPSRSRLFSLLGALLVSLAAACQPAAAQMVPGHMRAQSVDWSSPRSILMLCVALPMLPLYLIGLYYLCRRRNMYPIAGRGAIFLIVFNITALFVTAVCVALHLVYPDGLPCALHVMPGWVFVPMAAVMLLRGWILVFRLEILNFLTELDWRRSRKAQLQEKEERERAASSTAEQTDGEVQQVVQTLQPQPHPSPTVAADAPPLSPPRSIFVRVQPQPEEANIGAPSPIHSSTSSASISLEPASIPGYFFITHRRLTEPRLIIALLALTTVFLTVMVGLVGVFDPDIGLTNAWLRSRDLPDDPLKSHYTDGALWAAPRCLTHSIKMSSFHWCIALITPLIAFFRWRISKHTRRTKRRAEEQASFAAEMALAAGMGVAGDTAAGSSPNGRATRARSSSTAGFGEGGGDVGGVALKELDELSAVKRELALTMILAFQGMGLFVLQTAYTYEWVLPPVVLLAFLLFCNTCASAIYRSFVVSRRHRDMMARARRYASLHVNGRVVARVAHHAPLYLLQHVLHDAHAYPVLLHFLQKEYSSENALFFHEAARFARFSKKLERALPTWAAMVEESEETAHEDRGVERTVTLVHSIAGKRVTSAGSGVRPALSQKQTLALPMAGRSGSAPSTPPLRASAAPTVPVSPSITMGAVYPVLSESPSPVPPSSPSPSLPVPGSTASTLHPSSATASSSSSVELQAMQWQTGPGSGPRPGLSRPSSTTHTSTCWVQTAPQPRSPATIVGRTLHQGASFVAPGSGTWGGEAHAPHATSPNLAPRQPGSVARVHSSSRNGQPSLMRCGSSIGPTSSMFQSAAAAVNGSRLLTVHAGPSSATSSPKPAAPRRLAAAAKLSFRQMHEQAVHARQWALQLYADYLKPGAVYQINIGSDLRMLIRAQVRLLRQWQPTPLTAEGEPDYERAAMESAPPPPPPFPLSSLYQQTAMAVFTLMETDSFRRFLLTPEFQLLLQRADDEEVERLEKQAASGDATAAVLQQADAALRLAAAGADDPRTPRALWNRLQVGLLPGTPQATRLRDDTAPLQEEEEETEDSAHAPNWPQPLET